MSETRAAGATEKLLLSPGEAADALSIPKRQVFELLLRRRMRSYKIGRRRLIPVDALREFITQLAVEQPDGAIGDIVYVGGKSREAKHGRSDGRLGAHSDGAAAKARPARDRGKESQGARVESKRRNRRDPRSRDKGER